MCDRCKILVEEINLKNWDYNKVYNLVHWREIEKNDIEIEEINME